MSENIEVTEVTEEEAFETLSKLAAKTKDAERFSKQVQQKVVSPIVLARALDIRPQMIYNYIRAGRIEAVRENNTQKLYIELSVAMSFVARRLNKEAAQRAKIRAELEANS